MLFSRKPKPKPQFLIKVIADGKFLEEHYFHDLKEGEHWLLERGSVFRMLFESCIISMFDLLKPEGEPNLIAQYSKSGNKECYQALYPEKL